MFECREAALMQSMCCQFVLECWQSRSRRLCRQGQVRHAEQDNKPCVCWQRGKWKDPDSYHCICWPPWEKKSWCPSLSHCSRITRSMKTCQNNSVNTLTWLMYSPIHLSIPSIHPSIYRSIHLLFYASIIHPSIIIQVHLNKLECRGKVHLFQ